MGAVPQGNRRVLPARVGADRDQISTSRRENLAKKEGAAERAEGTLVPVADEGLPRRKARQALGVIKTSGINGSAMCRATTCAASGRLDAVDKQIKAVEDAAWKKTDPEADACKSTSRGS